MKQVQKNQKLTLAYSPTDEDGNALNLTNATTLQLIYEHISGTPTHTISAVWSASAIRGTVPAADLSAVGYWRWQPYVVDASLGISGYGQIFDFEVLDNLA